MDEKQKRQTREAEAIEAVANENEFEGEDLLEEIALLLPDYFETKEIKITEGAIEMRFYNGQAFSLKAKGL